MCECAKRDKNTRTVLELTLVTRESRSQVNVSSLSLSLSLFALAYHTRSCSSERCSRCNQLIEGSIEASVSSFTAIAHITTLFLSLSLSHSNGANGHFLLLSSPLASQQSIYFCGYFAYARANDFNSFPLFLCIFLHSLSLLRCVFLVAATAAAIWSMRNGCFTTNSSRLMVHLMASLSLSFCGCVSTVLCRFFSRHSR